MSGFDVLALADDGTLAPVEIGHGRRRVVTQRQARRLVRAAGGDPIRFGYTSTVVDAKAFRAAAKSPKAMVSHFETMATERKAFRDWKAAQASQLVK